MVLGISFFTKLKAILLNYLSPFPIYSVPPPPPPGPSARGIFVDLSDTRTTEYDYSAFTASARKITHVNMRVFYGVIVYSEGSAATKGAPFLISYI